ncbi:MAG: hypothetical protein AMQ22_02098 [Candidatus Methanofastidiosum methylothiophilum]|jgi:hypothetical protein|uniref:RiboL-PSP-HEPN domain-containing protein n=1 Tax=Candidatus Methanofastidiosum methylothiophilum TaxID=1705564 RepID=A0A150IP19_9EURY|nr:MAG: hypothetical protein AMQ22_02098 [Candidatus Methanofastidiosum methylthiophilus]
MSKIKIPHFNDNYYEVCSAVSAIISIQNAIKQNHDSIINNIVKNEVYDDDPEVNTSINNQIRFYTEDSVIRNSSNAYILLACSGFEKAMRLLYSDGLEKKPKGEGYGDYFKRISIVEGISTDTVNALNDIFIFRHWISHRNGRIQLQTVSKEEKIALERAGENIEMDNRYIIIKHDYVDNMVKIVDAFLKKIAIIMYERKS